MKKQTKIIIAIIAIVLIVVIAVVIGFMGKGEKTNLEPVSSAKDLTTLVEKVYEGQENLLPSLSTNVVDVADNNAVNMMTGLENGNDLEFVVASEPMMSSQAYSFVLAKVKDGVDADKVAKEMSEKVNPAKWICVSAEKVYATSSGDIVCLVMSSEEWGKPIYDKFKTLAGNVNEQYEETQDAGDFPEDETQIAL